MQFSSRPPYNDDPYPYLNPNCPDHNPCRRSADWDEYYAPRAMFDRPQHNPTNPILAEFRQEVEALGAMYPEDWLLVCTTAFWPYSQGRDAFLDHARKVLTRLANLSKGESGTS